MLKDSTETNKNQKKSADSKPTGDFGPPIKIIALGLGVFFLSQLLAVLILGLIVGLVAGESGLDSILNGSVAGGLALILLTEALTILFVYKLIGSSREGFRKIGLIRPKLKDIPIALGGFLAFYAILIVVSLILYSLIPSIDTDQKQDLGFENATSALALLIAFFSLVILPPIGEEILTRGYMFSGLRARLKFWPSAIIVSGLFGIAHLQLGNGEPPLWAAAVNTTVLSMVLVYLREKTGSLWPAIYVHAMNNAVAYVYLFKDSLF